jgi:hypothetical protein
MTLISRLIGRLKSGLGVPEQRVAARSTNPCLIVEIGGYDYRARDWSAGGACVQDFTGAIAVGDIVSGTLRWPRDNIGLAFAAEVMRLEQDGGLALRWLDLPERILNEMEARS